MSQMKILSNQVWNQYYKLFAINKKEKIVTFGVLTLCQIILKLNWHQCDQIGILLKNLGDIFCHKSNPSIGQLFVPF